jgi:hypothetical protein
MAPNFTASSSSTLVHKLLAETAAAVAIATLDGILKIVNFADFEIHVARRGLEKD